MTWPIDLREVLATFGIVVEKKLEEEIKEKTNKYLGILFEWNQKTNLTSCKTAEEFLKNHVILSYNFIPFIEKFETIFDFGSGNGVPGIPLSFLFSDKTFILVENRKRKLAFLEYISSALTKNVIVIDSSHNTPPKEYLSNFCVIAKAFSNIIAMKRFFKIPFELTILTEKVDYPKKVKTYNSTPPKIGNFEKIKLHRLLVE
ncbi:MAG: RsmG family class I SAM-dependent methyltransferase [Brevinematia bacterium]